LKRVKLQLIKTTAYIENYKSVNPEIGQQAIGQEYK